jgi:hypothetical protein
VPTVVGPGKPRSTSAELPWGALTRFLLPGAVVAIGAPAKRDLLSLSDSWICIRCCRRRREISSCGQGFDIFAQWTTGST